MQGLLNLNPIERWSPQQAKQHPFITGEPFTCPFQPPFISRKQHHVIPKSTSSTNNGYRNVPSQPTYSDPFLSTSYSSLPNTNGMSKRSSYIPPLPSVLEPPRTNIYSQHLQPHHPQQQQQQPLPPPPLQPQQQNIQQQQTLHIPQTGSSRPRANTVGTMQVPPQIQWATVGHSDGTVATEGSLYSPYYPYGQQHHHQQQQQQQQQYVNENSPKEGMDIGILPRWATNNRQTIDLERDGDWQEDTSITPTSPMANNNVIPSTTTNRLPHHKRSNSSVRFSDIPTSISSSVSSSMIHGNSSASRSSVASFHRLMRGHTIPYSRQDIEWDGVIHQTPPPPPPPAPVMQPSRSQHDSDDNDKWKNDNAGWMIA